LQLGTII